MEKADWSTFSARLKWARAQRGITQAKLAASAGMSQPNLNKLEKKGNASTKVIPLADELHVSARWLATGKGSPEDAGDVPPELLELVRAVEALPESQREFVIGMFVRPVTDHEVERKMPVTAKSPKKKELDADH